MTSDKMETWKFRLVVLAFVVVGVGFLIWRSDLVGVDITPQTEVVASMTVEEVLLSLGGAFSVGFSLVILYMNRDTFLAVVGMLRRSPIPAAEVRHAEGSVEVQGTAEPIDGTTESHFTGTPSLVHDWTKKEPTRRGRWKKVAEGEDAVPFYVTDDSGRIAVDPEGAAISLWSTGGETPDTPGGSEGRIEPGDTVHVYGQLRRPIEADETLGDETVYIGDGGGTFKISDTTELRTTLRSAGLGGAILLYVLVNIAFIAWFLL